MTKQKVYLDICCFNRPYDNQTQDIIMLETTAKLIIQNLILNKEIDLIWSYVLSYENSKSVHTLKRNAIANWQKLSAEYVGQSEEIELMAENIEKTGIKAYDALHVACAISANSDYFITVDKRLLKYKDERIVLCNPMQYISLYGGE